LLLFTGCRVGEILGLQWTHVHLERKLLLLPDSKTGAKAVYLSEPATEVLASIEQIAGNKYVLTGTRPGKPILSLRKPWLHLCAAADLKNVRLHDLRHSFASVGAAGGLSLPMIGALLGHTQPITTARYAHLAASPLHEAVDAIGARIVAAMTPFC
jgi:integrase